jgi:type IV fimbrial biogenesis protein FimT
VCKERLLMSSTSPTFSAAQRSPGGFTLIELMVTLTLLSLLLLLAVPSFTEWVRNNQIRSTAENLQNALRAAKGRAVNLNRQVVFVTTAADPALNALGAANSLNWYAQIVPRTAGEESTLVLYLEGGILASSTSGITVTGGPASICFNSLGRMVANATPSSSTDVPACAGAAMAFLVSRSGAVTGKDRKMRVTISTGGQIRMCDPDRPATSPEACP